MITHCDMDVKAFFLSPHVSRLKVMHRVPYYLQVPSCQFMSGPMHIFSQWLTQALIKI